MELTFFKKVIIVAGISLAVAIAALATGSGMTAAAWGFILTALMCTIFMVVGLKWTILVVLILLALLSASTLAYVIGEGHEDSHSTFADNVGMRVVGIAIVVFITLIPLIGLLLVGWGVGEKLVH